MRLPPSLAHRLSLGLFRAVIISTAILIGFASTNAYAAKSLSCSPSTLGFGNVALGQNETLLVTLTNNAQASMTISAINLSGAQFSLPPISLPLTLAAGQSLDVNVTFSPTNTDWTGGRITFVAPSNQSIAVSLGGRGTTVQPLTASPASVSFGSVNVGSSTSTTLVLTNTRTNAMSLSGLKTSGAGFSVSGANFPMSLGAGQSLQLNVTFKPTTTGSSGGRILVVGPALEIPLLGVGTNTPTVTGQLTMNPGALNFGNVTVGSAATLPTTLSASGASVTISSAQSSNGLFTMPGVSFPVTIPSGQSVSVNVTFSPQNTGAVSGAISFNSNASNASASESLSGTGMAAQTAGQLGMSPASLNFGNVIVGNKASLPATLSASGSSVTITSASSSSGLFSLSGVSLPLTISAGQSVAVSVAFSPQSGGAASGTLSFISNASNTPAKETLSGTGEMPYVSLSWSPSTSQVSGYNVYRCPMASCTYSKMNASPMANTSFTDTTVTPGQDYFYVTTAVDSTGTESGYSNQVEADVP